MRADLCFAEKKSSSSKVPLVITKKDDRQASPERTAAAALGITFCAVLVAGAKAWLTANVPFLLSLISFALSDAFLQGNGRTEDELNVLGFQAPDLAGAAACKDPV